MSSSYIYEIRLIKEYVLSGICHLLVPKSIIKCQTFNEFIERNITIQIVTHRID